MFRDCCVTGSVICYYFYQIINASVMATLAVTHTVSRKQPVASYNLKMPGYVKNTSFIFLDTTLMPKMFPNRWLSSGNLAVKSKQTKAKKEWL